MLVNALKSFGGFIWGTSTPEQCAYHLDWRGICSLTLRKAHFPKEVTGFSFRLGSEPHSRINLSAALKTSSVPFNLVKSTTHVPSQDRPNLSMDTFGLDKMDIYSDTFFDTLDLFGDYNYGFDLARLEFPDEETVFMRQSNRRFQVPLIALNWMLEMKYLMFRLIPLLSHKDVFHGRAIIPTKTIRREATQSTRLLTEQASSKSQRKLSQRLWKIQTSRGSVSGTSRS